MTTLTLEFSDELIEKLTQKAQQDGMELTTWLHGWIESAFDDDDEVTKEDILNDIREGIIEIMNGDYGIPAEEAMAKLRAELDNADHR